MIPKNVKDDFPIFRNFIEDNRLNPSGKPLIYFDNAATSQSPRDVIDAMNQFYCRYRANIHRGLHKLSEEATNLYEKAHEDMAKFLNAKDWCEIIFTKNLSEALNLVAYSVGSTLQDGDEVVTTLVEHHSNLVPWQRKHVRKTLFASYLPKGVRLRFLDVNQWGEIALEKAQQVICPKTKMVAVVHVSNFLGTINPITELAKLAHENDALFLADSAQGVPHMPVNVKDMDVDFLGFTGHKMLGPFGIGGIYGRRDVLEDLPPFLRGGGMISCVKKDHADWAPLPWKFEAGTPPVAEAIGLSAAIKYLEEIGMDNVRDHEKQLVKYTMKRLGEIPRIDIYGPRDEEKRGGLVSFNVEGMLPHDVSLQLDEVANIAVRSGHHCAQPAHEMYGIKGSVRASYHIYNDEEEIDKMLEILAKLAMEEIVSREPLPSVESIHT